MNHCPHTTSTCLTRDLEEQDKILPAFFSGTGLEIVGRRLGNSSIHVTEEIDQQRHQQTDSLVDLVLQKINDCLTEWKESFNNQSNQSIKQSIQ